MIQKLINNIKKLNFRKIRKGRYCIEYDCNYIIEIYTKEIGFGLSLNQWDDQSSNIHIRLLWPDIYIKLPPIFNISWWEYDLSYGISWFESSIHLKYGKNTKIIEMPWNYEFVRRTVFNDKNEIVIQRYNQKIKGQNIGKEVYEDELHKLVNSYEYDYRYCTREFEIQKTKAKYYVQEYEWKPKFCVWLGLNLFRKIEKSIDVWFDKGIGEGVNTWKGGTIGCSYTMKEDETPQECIRRMEYERKFR